MARRTRERPRRWQRFSAVEAVLCVLAVLAVAGLVVLDLDELHESRPAIMSIPHKYVKDLGAISDIMIPLAVAGAGYLLFIFWRMSIFRRPYTRDATQRPDELVQTSGTILGEVVGRDELCATIMEDLRDTSNSRPHIIVGGVGAGKTAMLVRLTSLLAQNRAVPVPIRLRDCEDALDFREAARARFCEHVKTFRFSRMATDRIWQHLCNNNKIVVLADGLEEALQGLDGMHVDERDHLIRLAVHRAHEEHLPIVIASRPSATLRGIDASVTDLEPLSERDALLYLRRHGTGAEDARLQWVVETAEVSQSPLYLQIADDLNTKGLLHHVAEHEENRLDTRGVDRVGLRLRLMGTWVETVARGLLKEDVPLSTGTRQATVEQLSALACVGLRMDSLYVKFADFICADRDVTAMSPERMADQAGQDDQKKEYDRGVRSELERRLTELGRPLDLQLATAYGQQLGLVEAHRDGVRFPHSIMQTYLGSRYVGAALQSDLALRGALMEPGREFLLALVMYTRTCGPDPHASMNGRVSADSIGERMYHAARTRARRGDGTVTKLDAKTLDLHMHAVQIAPEAAGDRIARSVKSLRTLICQTQRTPEKVVGAPRDLEESKLQFVFRLGEALRRARRMGRHQQEHDRRDLMEAYRELFALGTWEPIHAVRLAAAIEIGSGGDLAYEALDGLLGPPEQLQSHNGHKGRNSEADDEHRLRDQVMRAWLAPLLAGSVSTPSLYRQAKLGLEYWCDHVAGSGASGPYAVNLRVALAQGFKLAANRRRCNPHSSEESRAHLVDQATNLLHGIDLWHSRISLLHALTLWALPDGADGAEMAVKRRGAQSSDALVRRWMTMKGNEVDRMSDDGATEHPFVACAAKLCVLALESGQAERFVWIDECSVLSKTGSGPGANAAPARRDLWIPASAGWSNLDPRAQQLVADVLVLLDLAEGGQSPGEREGRLARTETSALPTCLTKDRRLLEPGRAVRGAEPTMATAGCASECPFELCPFPTKGQQWHRAELSEAFCRRQKLLLRLREKVKPSRWRRTAPWQGETARRLTSFWEDMAQRSRR